MLTTVRHIFGRIMHSETALCSQWDKGWKNNLLFASPSIRRPTHLAPPLYLMCFIRSTFIIQRSFLIWYSTHRLQQGLVFLALPGDLYCFIKYITKHQPITPSSIEYYTFLYSTTNNVNDIKFLILYLNVAE